MDEMIVSYKENKTVQVCKIMATLALVGACVAIAMVAAVVFGQSGVKQIFMAGMADDTFVVPYGNVVLRVIKAVIIIVCMVNIKKFENSSSAYTFAMISVIGCVILNVLGVFTNFIDMNMAGALGTPALASMSAVNSAISLLASPFEGIAFIFSCIVLGITIAVNMADNQ